MTSAWIEGMALRSHPLSDSVSSKVFVMLVAYMDDSGTHDGAHNSVLGGYWGSVNEWRRFERAWKPIVTTEGIEEFHAKEFWPRIPGKGRVGPYKDWSDQRHANFIDQLLRVIESTKITPFACGVYPSEWKGLSEQQKAFYSCNEAPRLQNPLALSLYRVIMKTASYAHSHKVMHFVMDINKTNPNVQRAMLSVMAEIKRTLRQNNDPLVDRIGGLTFDESHIATPLQAADLIAYEAHRYAKAANGTQECPVRREYARALYRFRSKDDFWLFDEPRLKNLDGVLRAATLEAKRANEIE